MSIKIFVGYHKPSNFLIKSDLFIPIQLGRKVADQASKDGALNKEDILWMNKNTIGDDTGDNISELNRYYCELTGIYWIYKNYKLIGNPDYVGFMHYRRLLDFDGTISKKFFIKHKNEGLFITGVGTLKIYKKLIQLYSQHYSSECVEEIINKYKVIKLKSETNLMVDKREKHKFEIEYVKEHYPEIYVCMQKQFNEAHFNYKNMFVLQRDDFLAYAKFIFEILHLNEDEIEPREKGFLAEILTSAYLEYLSQLHHSSLECSCLYLSYRKPLVKLKIFAYQIGSALTFGETKRKLKKKRRNLKAM